MWNWEACQALVSQASTLGFGGCQVRPFLSLLEITPFGTGGQVLGFLGPRGWAGWASSWEPGRFELLAACPHGGLGWGRSLQLLSWPRGGEVSVRGVLPLVGVWGTYSKCGWLSLWATLWPIAVCLWEGPALSSCCRAPRGLGN